MERIANGRTAGATLEPGLVRYWPLALVTVVWALLYRAPIAEMTNIWLRSDTFAHGIIVLPISLWLAWRAAFWREFEGPRPTLLALPLVLGFALLWLAGALVSAAGAVHFATVGLLVSALWCAMGNTLARRLAFPLGFLFFAPPVGEFLVPTLMDHTAEFTVWALRITGVPVFQEGLHFVLPNGRWSVVEACSGIRYLIASLMVGTLYAYLTYTSLKKRLIFGIFALAMPVLANWLRAYLIVMIGYLSNNKLAAGVDHLIYGWVFFGLVIFGMFWIGSRWRDDTADAQRTVTAPPAATGRGAAGAMVPLVLVLAAPGGLDHLLAPEDRAVAVRTELPVGEGGWTRAAASSLQFEPLLAGYRDLARATYLGGRGELTLWAALYAHQSEGHELVNWANRVVRDQDGNKDWTRLEQGTRVLAGDVVKYLRLRGPDGDVDVFHWYRIGERRLASDVAAKLQLARDRLTGSSDASHYVVVAIRADSAASAQAWVDDFLRSNGTALDAALQHAVGSVE
ncbi:MAG: exosortase A [Rhodocyclaceae bacterium]|nr:exosortase A [Rhodocyclaceae bacterium]